MPAVVLRNDELGIGIGGKRNTTKPHDDGSTVVVVTDRRTLGLIGRADGEAVVEVPHDEVAEVNYKTGFRRHRFVVTTPRTAYHFWVSRGFQESALDTAAAVVDRGRRGAGDGPKDTSDSGQSPVMYRGQAVQSSTSASQSESSAATDGGPGADGGADSDGTAEGTDDAGEADDAVASSEGAEDETEESDGADSSGGSTVMYRGQPVER